jgi:hypothetical protein
MVSMFAQISQTVLSNLYDSLLAICVMAYSAIGSAIR